jgi:hypothetical protein
LIECVRSGYDSSTAFAWLYGFQERLPISYSTGHNATVRAEAANAQTAQIADNNVFMTFSF